MNVHHVLPVADGGDGLPDNLVALCPNCHSTVHQIRKLIDEDNEIALELIGSWVLSAYPAEQSNLLGGIAYGTAQLEDEKWVAFNCPFSVE